MNDSFLNYLVGSTPDDFDQARDDPPFEPCAVTPNCTFHSVVYPLQQKILFTAIKKAIDQLSPYKITSKSESFQIDAVFRIRMFGFKDDVRAVVESTDQGSILHIKSASRIGRSDLGVNRRRIRKILQKLDQLLL